VLTLGSLCALGRWFKEKRGAIHVIRSTSRDELREILEKPHTAAVVGCSRNSYKAAHSVPAYLQHYGYTIIPVNPYADQILGEQAYGSLAEIPDEIASEVDMLIIFRPQRELAGVLEDVLKFRKGKTKLEVVWFQLGLMARRADKQAWEEAWDSGLTVVENRCIKVDHAHLVLP